MKFEYKCGPCKKRKFILEKAWRSEDGTQTRSYMCKYCEVNKIIITYGIPKIDKKQNMEEDKNGNNRI